MKASLRAADGEVVIDDELVIGRDGEIAIADARVSKRHCRVFASDGAWYVEDLRSDNGTFINDKLVVAPRRLASGDVVRLGPARQPLWTAQFLVELPSLPKPLAPSPSEPPPHVCEAPDLRDRLAVSEARAGAIASALAAERRRADELQSRLDDEFDHHRTTRLALRDVEDRHALAVQRTAALAAERERGKARDALLGEMDALRTRAREQDALLASARADVARLLADHADLRDDFERALELAEDRRRQLDDARAEAEVLRDELARLRRS